MYLKNGLSILLVSLLFISVTSCLGDEEEIEKITSADAQITAFSLLHDSIPALSKTVFTIDQANGLIFNHDSLPFETVLYDSIKLQYTAGSELAMNIKVLYGETPVWRTSGDSV
ncbi:MAG: DUF6242 domain-containing protein, partial [Candidatus Symbiothrix sp.]|nr:DUF6242 domain-containing protein [Candidatus Symbiothrix sp.]